ncbi:hypothetical protein [Immundisolibacter cernigliae]|uniref:hypothetical protein n=1 Tax=Immundisolibacter cernigliae TaxID=1810504 RepID=UPI0011AB3BA5|nr:hypothetical protein [Immundisolibacter cernigliae]
MFIDRQRQRERLVVLLAGHKSFLWPYVIPRLARTVSADYDVCIASSGVDDTKLRAYCEEYGWSYLATKKNKVGLAVNLAIAAHEHALLIHKIDEDMFLTSGMLERLERTYHRISASGLAKPGACAPLININGYTYQMLLDKLGLTEEFRQKFGHLGYSHPHQVFRDPESVVWLWRHCLPLDALGERIANAANGYSFVPVRFSIGAILFERQFWGELGGFRVGTLSGTLGLDEEVFCKECVDRFRPIVVSHDAFAGHFSFFNQEQSMRDALPGLAALDPNCFSPVSGL